MPVFECEGVELEYERDGDTRGMPVLMHHGLLCSATVPPANRYTAVASSVELIAIARPGYGKSSPAPMVAVVDWVDLVTPLLGHLEIERFSVWAYPPAPRTATSLRPVAQIVSAAWVCCRASEWSMSPRLVRTMLPNRSGHLGVSPPVPKAKYASSGVTARPKASRRCLRDIRGASHLWTPSRARRPGPAAKPFCSSATGDLRWNS